MARASQAALESWKTTSGHHRQETLPLAELERRRHLDDAVGEVKPDMESFQSLLKTSERQQLEYPGSLPLSPSARIIQTFLEPLRNSSINIGWSDLSDQANSGPGRHYPSSVRSTIRVIDDSMADVVSSTVSQQISSSKPGSPRNPLHRWFHKNINQNSPRNVTVAATRLY